MKIRNFFAGAIIMAAALFTGCEPEEQLGMPEVTLGATELEFTQDAGTQDMTFTATREWKVEYDADWIAVTPERGQGSNDAQTISVAVTANNGGNRSAKVTVTIGLESKAFTVNQAGPGGDNGAPSVSGDVVYSNDFDKVEATKTYGSGESWPYLDQFDGWMNQAGPGAANVTFAYEGMSARANSTSNSDYSDYEGSGKNNMFFGKNAYFATYNIALGDKVNFALSFGTEKYDGNNKTAKFDPAEFHVWLSNDGKKWVELAYTFAGTEAGRWNVASTEFSVPAGTANLSVCVSADVASVYRMDDFKISSIEKTGTAVDFSKGVEKNFSEGSGNTGGDNGNASVPESKGKKTVQEFIAAADDANYYELTGTVSGFNSTYCSFDLTDATGKIYVYSVLADSKSQWSSKIKNGGTVTIYGKYMFYEQKSQHEVVDAYIVSYTPGEGGNEGGNDDGGDDAGSGIEADWAYTFAKDDFGSEYSGPVTVTLNGLTWKFEMDATFLGFDTSNGRGLQMSKKAEPATLITLSTEGVTGTIKKIVVNTSGASGTDAVLTVSVGGNQYGEPVAVTKSAADYTFEGSASGKLELKWTNSAQAAVYIKSIAIELE